MSDFKRVFAEGEFEKVLTASELKEVLAKNKGLEAQVMGSIAKKGLHAKRCYDTAKRSQKKLERVLVEGEFEKVLTESELEQVLAKSVGLEAQEEAQVISVVVSGAHIRKPRRYSMAKRLRKKRMKDLKNTLEEIKRLELEEAHPKRVIEGTPQIERKRAARLRKLPKDRVCPICLETKLDSRQWDAIGPNTVCLSCVRRGKELSKPIAEMRKPVKTRAQRTLEARNKFLPADRICPSCFGHYPVSRQWIIEEQEEKLLVRCIKCSREGKNAP